MFNCDRSSRDSRLGLSWLHDQLRRPPPEEKPQPKPANWFDAEWQSLPHELLNQLRRAHTQPCLPEFSRIARSHPDALDGLLSRPELRLCWLIDIVEALALVQNSDQMTLLICSLLANAEPTIRERGIIISRKLMRHPRPPVQAALAGLATTDPDQSIRLAAAQAIAL